MLIQLSHQTELISRAAACVFIERVSCNYTPTEVFDSPKHCEPKLWTQVDKNIPGVNSIVHAKRI